MKFSKLQGAGNDFIIINDMNNEIVDFESLAKKVCDRHFGIGADGMLVCQNSNTADVKMVYYNSDGTRAKICGNGIRCFSKFVYENQVVEKNNFYVETDAGIKYITTKIEKNKVKEVSVDMGKGDFISKNIPCTIEKNEILNETLDIEGKKIVFSSILMGVPHTVIFVDDFSEYNVLYYGKLIENHKIFPKRTNVNFAKVVGEDKIELKTWERGAGYTLGCGTGACATGILAYKLGKIKTNKMKIVSDGGEIKIEITDDYNVKMSGGATLICSGKFY